MWCTNRLLWRTNSDFYGIRTPPFMAYEPVLLGVGVVFNLLKLYSDKEIPLRRALRHLPCSLGSQVGVHQKLGCSFFAYSWKLLAYSGAFLLTVDNFSFFAYSLSFFAYSFSFLTYSWSFFAYSEKVLLIRALRDCKPRSLTVSKEAPTVSKKASPHQKYPVSQHGTVHITVLNTSSVANASAPYRGQNPQKIGKRGFRGQKPVKSKRGREEGDGTEFVINCRKVSYDTLWHFMTLYDVLWRFMTFYVKWEKRRKLS